MGFSITPAQGLPAELDSDLESPPKHEREEEVVATIKDCITDIVNSLGGYLSVAASGNINQVSGETGDVVNIYITSLPAPGSTTPPPAEVPAEVAPTEGVSVAPETPVTETSLPTELGAEPAPVTEAPVTETTPTPVQTEIAPTPETSSSPEVPVAETPAAEQPVTPPSETPEEAAQREKVEAGEKAAEETTPVTPVTPPVETAPTPAPVEETAPANPESPAPVTEPTPAENAPENPVAPSPETTTQPETVEGTVVIEPGDKVEQG